jgi:hypothetical protein
MADYMPLAGSGISCLAGGLRRVKGGKGPACACETGGVGGLLIEPGERDISSHVMLEGHRNFQKFN